MARFFRRIVFAACTGFCVASAGSVRADDFTFHHENVMGTSLELRVQADDAESARGAEARVLRTIDRLSKVFSGYDRTSEFARWRAGPRGPVVVSSELFEVLAASDHWRSRSGGAFDPRVDALSRLWASAAKRDRPPEPGELAAALGSLAAPAWRLDASARTAEQLSEAPLSLDAIAKGFIVEKACDAALDSSRGVHGLLLNVGGDLRVVGETPRLVGIVAPWADSETAAPLTFVEVKDRAVATSGRSQRGFRIQGRWYSHILDPRSGFPAEGVASATVIAPRSADADALATILNVLPVESGLRLAGSLPGVDCLIVGADGRTSRTPGWDRYERSGPADPTPATGSLLARASAATDPASQPPTRKTNRAVDPAPPATGWGSTHELVVQFEINRPADAGGRYRRPYVAVWVEDRNGAVVRNLALWVSQTGAGPFQWLPDLRRWFRADKERKKTDPTEMLFTLARPTRPPGKYTVVWNARDDRNEPVPPGEYTVTIEAAREHGTYQSISKKVTIADRPFVEELTGNVEIKSASIEYRRRAGGTAPR